MSILNTIKRMICGKELKELERMRQYNNYLTQENKRLNKELENNAHTNDIYNTIINYTNKENKRMIEPQQKRLLNKVIGLCKAKRLAFNNINIDELTYKEAYLIMNLVVPLHDYITGYKSR
jgi:hypothetical protein